MSCESNDITIVAGASRTWRVTVTDEETAEPYDITGAVVEFQVKLNPGDADPALIAKSTATSGVAILAQSGATLGQLEISLVPADTSGLAGKYHYDVVVTLAGKRDYVIEPSVFYVKRNVNPP